MPTGANESFALKPWGRLRLPATGSPKGPFHRSGKPQIRHLLPIVIIQDADLEYNLTQYPKMVDTILIDRVDVVFGSRFIGNPFRE